MLHALTCSKNQINWHNKILFLEDEGETGERLDRYFRHILEIAVEQKKYPRAILLGNLLLPNNHGTPQQKNVRIAVQRLLERLVELEENSKGKVAIALFEEKTNPMQPVSTIFSVWCCQIQGLDIIGECGKLNHKTTL
ncbi:MAG: LD-carboxypeptidase [Sediminibacterium sp.]|nr:LD-carboxypeptidase [Sediminibacterium sp.]